jgi:hypothetical protein
MTALFSQGSYFTRDSGAVAISVIAGKLSLAGCWLP